MYTCTGAKNRGAKAQSTDRQSSRWRRPCEGTLYERDRRLRCEDEKTSLRLSAMCGLLLFFLWSWQRHRRSEIGCYSARRGAAFHCIAWEMFEHWWKSNRWVRVWEFFAMKWPRLLSLEKPKRKDISLDDRSWAWRTRLFKFKWRKSCVGLRHFFFWIFFCQNSFDRDVGQFAAKWLAFLAMCRNIRHTHRELQTKHLGSAILSIPL